MADDRSVWNRYAFYRDFPEGWLVVIVGHTPRTPPSCGQHEVITFSTFLPTFEDAQRWARPHMEIPQ